MPHLSSAVRRMTRAWLSGQPHRPGEPPVANRREAQLRDLGLVRLDESLFWTGDRAPLEQLPRMMAVYGVEHADTILAGPGVRRDMERVCSLCPEKARCTRVLQSDPDRTACRFCPNASILEALSRD